MNAVRRLFAAVALLAALPLYADSVRGVLHAPRSGDLLRGGTTATVEWSASQLPREAEEWEAFLSVDGGRFYAYRITPHLDLETRRFAFDVPNVATRDARLLIRVGNEREEIEIELPVTFAIEQDPLRAIAEPPLAVIDAERGEAARAGQPGVVQWIDGDRAGRHLATRTALRPENALTSARSIAEPLDIGEAEASLHGAARVETVALRTIAEPARALRLPPIHRAGRDVLLAYRRLNI